MTALLALALGAAAVGATTTIDLRPPTPVGTQTTLYVAYMPECSYDEFNQLVGEDVTSELSLVASEECQADPFTDYTKSMQIWCRPNQLMEFRSYDNINCRGEPTRVTKFLNGFCHEEFDTGGFVVNWLVEDWNAICAPPGTDDADPTLTKGDFCRSQEQKEGRKSCLAFTCCSWQNDRCVANANACEDRRKATTCMCPDFSMGQVINPISDIHDGVQDGCSCPVVREKTCVSFVGDEWMQLEECKLGETCGYGFLKDGGKGKLDMGTIVNCDGCCTNGICVECDPDKEDLPQCTDQRARASIQQMLLDNDFTKDNLDLIGCAMTFLGQRTTDGELSVTLCNCYKSFTRDQWARAPRKCWVNEQETKNTVTQYERCNDFLGISECSKYTRKSKCLRKHSCVWSDPKKFKCDNMMQRFGEDGGNDKWKSAGEKYIQCMDSAGWAPVDSAMKKVQVPRKRCVPALTVVDMCNSIPKMSKCNSSPECVWRFDEGCIADGPYACEGLQRAKCTKQKRCFFQNPYGCRKNRHRHDQRDKKQRLDAENEG